MSVREKGALGIFFSHFVHLCGQFRFLPLPFVKHIEAAEQGGVLKIVALLFCVGKLLPLGSEGGTQAFQFILAVHHGGGTRSGARKTLLQYALFFAFIVNQTAFAVFIEQCFTVFLQSVHRTLGIHVFITRKEHVFDGRAQFRAG